MKEKRAYALPECTVVTVAQENVICASGDPQQTGNRSDYSYGGNWGIFIHFLRQVGAFFT